MQVANSRIEVLIAEEFERPRYQEMAEKATEIIRGLNITLRNRQDKSINVVSLLVFHLASIAKSNNLNKYRYGYQGEYTDRVNK
ncbi:MAG: hypothetical protein ACRD93_02515 [Nitrososphaeraceae archaeon]